MTDPRISDEVPPPVEAGRETSLRYREERRIAPTWLPVRPGSHVAIDQADRLVCEKVPLSLRSCHGRGRLLLSLGSFPGPPTPCGAPVAFRCSRRRTTAEAGNALQSGIGTPGVSAGTRAGMATVPRTSARFPGESWSRCVSTRTGASLEAGLADGSRHPSNDAVNPDRVSGRRPVLCLRRTIPRYLHRHDLQSRTQGGEHPSLPHEADMCLRNRVLQIAVCAPRGSPRRQSYARS